MLPSLIGMGEKSRTMSERKYKMRETEQLRPEEAFRRWLEQRPKPENICVFAGLPEAKETDEPTYKCVHGKRLTWQVARQVLRLA